LTGYQNKIIDAFIRFQKFHKIKNSKFMNKSPLVSILIPTYNRKNKVEIAINSALSQTYENIEIIVSDNCSLDGTVDHIRDLYKNIKKVKIFENPINSGPVSNWINCVEKSSGRFTKLLFSDDTISANYIEETVRILKSDKDIGFVYTPSSIETSSKKRLFYNTYNTSRKIESSKIEIRFLIDFNVPVSPGAALFRRSDLLENIKTSIKNPKGKDFNTFGAGTDLNIYFELMNKYKYVYFSNETRAHFFGDNTSFTISNNLDYFYQTVRFNYLAKKKPSLKLIVIKLIVKLKITKLFNYLPPYFN
jgi:glycosyltransferase involved in cell wall biosynthesis